MTHRRPPQVVPRKRKEPAEIAAVSAASPAHGMSLFDPWGVLENLSRLSGLLVLSPEKNQAWTKNWTVLWSDQMRRCAFYLKWPMGLG